MKDIIIDKARGCLVGGAAGDALGYAVEFSSLHTILNDYGPAGITAYHTDSKGIARFSDDTQMTLFTAEGLLSAFAKESSPNTDLIRHEMKKALLAWLETQIGFQLPISSSWLTHVRDLWARRAPGNTCISALSDLRSGRDVHNDSKGCGAVMRIAPIGVFFGALDLKDAAELETTRRLAARVAADNARLTHCHALSTLSAVFTASLIFECMRVHVIDRLTLRSLIVMALSSTLTAMPGCHYAE